MAKVLFRRLVGQRDFERLDRVDAFILVTEDTIKWDGFISLLARTEF